MSPTEVDATASLPEEDIIPGSPYHFIGIAGIGGAGTVYKAIDKKVQRTVAIKAISPSLFERFDGEKFKREAKAISKLQHPNVLTILDSGSMTDGRPFLVTEWIEGCTLAQYLKRYGNLSLEAAEEVFCSVLDGLSHAHNRQIVHRDVKPGNIMLSRTKYGWIVKVEQKHFADLALAEINLSRRPGLLFLTIKNPYKCVVTDAVFFIQAHLSVNLPSVSSPCIDRSTHWCNHG